MSGLYTNLATLQQKVMEANHYLAILLNDITSNTTIPVLKTLGAAFHLHTRTHSCYFKKHQAKNNPVLDGLGFQRKQRCLEHRATEHLSITAKRWKHYGSAPIILEAA